MGHCANCGRQLPDDAKFCFACNTRQDSGEKPPESPPSANTSREKEPTRDTVATARARKCSNCGAQLPEDARFCFACGTACVSNGTTSGKTSSQRPIPRWVLAAIGVCAVAAIVVLVWRATPSEPAPSVPPSAVTQPSTPAATRPAVAASPASLSLVCTVGQPGPTQPVTISSSDIAGNHTWRARQDALWLDVAPSSGSFDLGTGEFSVNVSTDGLQEGTHTGTISLSIDGFEGEAATIQVTLEVRAPEDPQAEAARKCWESSVFRTYWDSGAASDVRAVVRGYKFPEYVGVGTVDKVDIKSVEFAFTPDVYPRAIARVHCSDKFVVADLEAMVRTTWFTDTMVILQVAPGPYDSRYNEWDVVAAGDWERMVAEFGDSMGWTR